MLVWLHRTEGPEGMVESLVDMLQTGALQGQVYAARALSNLAADPSARDRILSAGAAEVILCCLSADQLYIA